VVPADNGFRAEYARIAAIFAVVREVSMEQAQLRRIAELYDVPLLVPYSLGVEDYRILLREGNGDIDVELRELTGQARTRRRSHDHDEVPPALTTLATRSCWPTGTAQQVGRLGGQASGVLRCPA
jgi:hypothetical protein